MEQQNYQYKQNLLLEGYFYKMPKTDLKSKTLDELETLLTNLKKEGMNLRFQKSMGQLEKPSRIRHVRREISRIKTFINLKEIKKNA